MRKLVTTLRNSAGAALVLAFAAVWAPRRHGGRWVQWMPHWTAGTRMWAALALAIGLFAVLTAAGVFINVRRAVKAPRGRPAPAAPARRRRAGAY